MTPASAMDTILIDIVAVNKTSQYQTHEKVVTPHYPSCNIPAESIQQGLDLSTQNASILRCWIFTEKENGYTRLQHLPLGVIPTSGETNDETYMFIRKKSCNELGDTGLYGPAAMGQLVDMMTNVFVVQFPHYVKGYNLLANV